MNWSLRSLTKLLPVVGLIAFGLLGVTPADADHSWGGYHWARKANPFTLKVVDSMTTDWDDNLDRAISDWDVSQKFVLVKEAGSTEVRDRRQCRAISGKIRACNAGYGFNGWLGLAQIWITDGVHITKAVAKMNDSYLSSTSYTETNRQHVICQEIGHDFGLDHQDESGADLNTCMDYSRALDNPSPNQHDYDQLDLIYAHLDSTTTIASSTASSGPPYGRGNAPEDLPDGVDEHGLPLWASPAHGDTYEVDLGNGVRLITHVFWVRGPGARP